MQQQQQESNKAQKAFIAAQDVYQRDYQAFMQIVGALPENLRDQQGACGHWSPQDIIKHLCGWLTEAKRRYDRLPYGSGDYVYDADAMNEVFLWERKNQSWDMSVAELQGCSQVMQQAAQKIPAYQAEREPRYQRWLDAISRNYRDHGSEIVTFQEATHS